MSDVVTNLKTFMQDDLGVDTADISLDTPLFSAGVIDSFSLVSLLTYVESTYQFRIGPTDVNLANFDSLGRMLAYIEPRRGD